MQSLSDIKKETIPYSFLYKISGLITILSIIPSFLIISIYSFVVPTKSIFNLTILCLLMCALVFVLDFLENSKFLILNESAKEIDNKIYNKVLIGIANSKNTSRNSILEIHADIIKINSFIKKGIDFIFIELCLSLVFLFPLFLLSFKLGLLGFFFIGIIFLKAKIKEEKLKELTINKNNNEKQITKIWDEIKHNKETQLNKLIFKNYFIKKINHSLSIGIEFSELVLRNKTFNRMLTISMGSIFMGYAFLLFINNEVDFLAIILTSILAVKAISPWVNLLNYKKMKVEYNEAEKRINNLLININEEIEKINLDLPLGKLEINIIQSYPDINSLSNLRGVGFNLIPGEMLVLLGKNGSGKTSLIKSITGENFISKESYCKISGVDINNLSEDQKLINIGYLSQANEIMIGNLIKNIWRFSDNHDLNTTINKIIEVSSLKNLLEKEDMSVFSIGEIRKILLLRTICKNPRLILLDNPENSLDDEGLQMLSNIIRWAKNNKAIIITATNDLNIIKMANKGLLLENGKMIKFGEITEFLKT